MKIFMYHSDNGGCGYFRVKQPAKWLAKHCEVKRLPDEYSDKIIPFEDTLSKDYNKEIGTFKAHAEWADVLCYQRVDKPELVSLMYAVRQVLKKEVVVDYDDDLFNVPPDNPAYRVFFPGSEHQFWCMKAMTEASLVTVSTKYLADEFRKYNKNIEVIPNYVDLEVMGIEKEIPKSDDKVVIGWIGSPTHYKDFKECLSALKRVLRHQENVIFKYAGMETDYLADLRKEFGENRIVSLGWIKNSEYYQKLKELDIDIYIAPLQRHPFNDGKSNLKWLEASALKKPLVASKVGAFDNIEDGINGFIAIDESDWYYILSNLVKDKHLREKIGNNAYNDVKNNWNIETRIKDRIEIYQRYLQ